jgi:protease-4
MRWMVKPWPWQPPKVALVEVHGPLLQSGRVGELARAITALAQQPWVRAAVVDIDSSGGSATLAEQLHRAVGRLSQSKPVVAYVSNVALSGAYLVACAARRIVAPPTALVGSIGVIIARPVVRELLERIGVRMFVSRVGEHKDMMQPWREPTPEEVEKLAALRDEYYDWFIRRVAEARRLPLEEVRRYATGEFFTASRARELGLVDDLGDLEMALDMACEMGRTPRQLVSVRPRRPLLERILSPVGAALAERILQEVEARLHMQVLLHP